MAAQVALGQTAGVVFSQIYGGGGNAGATLKNDFVELFNRTDAPVALEGWKFEYASATGEFTQSTALVGTIPANGYYLIAQAAGAGGTVDLPTPDVSGSIAMSATAAKVRIVRADGAGGVDELLGAVKYDGFFAAGCGVR
ncbi:MAG: lamin tail domain-containing protein [Acidobacteria bacterium]|nr:lamin tail domain-containing protein [Acidobacteriota bacterium]